MPVKPVKAYSNKSFKQDNYAPYGNVSAKNGYENNSYRDERGKSNYEALSPIKKSTHSNYNLPSLFENNNYSFASNFKKSQQTMGHSNQEIPPAQRKMQAAGNNVMRYNSNESFWDENRWIESYPSQITHMNSFSLNNSFETPKKSKCYLKFWIEYLFSCNQPLLNLFALFNWVYCMYRRICS